MGACLLVATILLEFAEIQSSVDELTIWPALVVLAFPILFVSMLHHRGKEEYSILIEKGNIPGILEEGVTLEQWEGFEDFVRHKSLRHLH